MKKLKDIALIVFVLSLTILIFSCSKKSTEPEIPDLKEMVLVPGGTFTMGRTRDDVNEYPNWDDELPTHSVTLNSFYIGKYQVRQSEYEAIMGYNPSTEYYDYGFGDDYPVNQVNWYDAIKYCNLRSMNEGLMPVYSVSGSTDPEDWGEVPYLGEDGLSDPIWDAAICDWSANGYRLLTEAEWEYAARGASNDPDYLYSGSDTIDDVAWYGINSESTMHPVGGKAANELGIYDMSGNVFEWCWDWFGDYSSSPSVNPKGPESGLYRCLRGGCWSLYNEINCRVFYRTKYNPNYRYPTVGFRVCRSVN